MIEPEVFQAQLVARLRGDADLIAALPEAAAGVREAEWHGTAFQYPCVRVRRPEMSPHGNGNCSHRISNATFEVLAVSKRDSSITAQQVQGLIHKALEGVLLETADLRTIPIRTMALAPTGPSPQEADVWLGGVGFRTVVIER